MEYQQTEPYSIVDWKTESDQNLPNGVLAPAPTSPLPPNTPLLLSFKRIRIHTFEKRDPNKLFFAGRWDRLGAGEKAWHFRKNFDGLPKRRAHIFLVFLLTKSAAPKEGKSIYDGKDAAFSNRDAAIVPSLCRRRCLARVGVSPGRARFGQGRRSQSQSRCSPTGQPDHPSTFERRLPRFRESAIVRAVGESSMRTTMLCSGRRLSETQISETWMWVENRKAVRSRAVHLGRATKLSCLVCVRFRFPFSPLTLKLFFIPRREKCDFETSGKLYVCYGSASNHT